jgi:hypothetical protein
MKKLMMLTMCIWVLVLGGVVQAAVDGIGVFEPGTGEWNIAGASTVTFGAGNPYAVAGDWDGDGIDGLAVFDSENWLLADDAASPVVDYSGIFGYTSAYNYEVLSGDWDGDGVDGIGFHIDVAGGHYFVQDVTAMPGALYTQDFNLAGWGLGAGGQSVAGDWDGDGDDEIALYGSGTWFISMDSASVIPGPIYPMAWGEGGPNVQAIAGDWDGDGIDGIGLFDPDTDTWYLSNTAATGAQTDMTFVFGNGTSTQVAIVGNFVPEPATMALLACGGLLMRKRRNLK